MTKILTLLLLLSSMAFSLDWAKNLDTALSKAKREHKTLMVFVEGEHCRWCKKMKHRTISDDAVEKRLEKFVVVEVMRENVQAMSHLPSVRGVPTIFFMKADKTVLEEVIGYFCVEDFLSYIDDVEKKTR
ncbi:MAG: DUF255 domain-containing protein [Sulfurovum sp.]|nr:DUF255 domain-containing protein [Sulfurovum sp.]